MRLTCLIAIFGFCGGLEPNLQCLQSMPVQTFGLQIKSLRQEKNKYGLREILIYRVKDFYLQYVRNSLQLNYKKAAQLEIAITLKM